MLTECKCVCLTHSEAKQAEMSAFGAEKGPRRQEVPVPNPPHSSGGFQQSSFQSALNIQSCRKGVIICCKLHGTGVLCSCRCPHRSGHYTPLNLQQGKCYSLFRSFVYLYECKCVCYIFKGQSPENGLFCIFQAVGNTLLQKVQRQHDSAQEKKQV